MTIGFRILRFIIENLFLLFFLYQAVYSVISLIRKPEKLIARKNHRYAVLICARNEQRVISGLLKSLEEQDYPRDRYSVFVLADNCSDGTAARARASGAIVYERHDSRRRGKGYALSWLLRRIKKDFGYSAYDGYVFFDADNLVHKKFLAEVNKYFDNGYRVITTCRSTKNFQDSWVAGCSALWFLRNMHLLNRARQALGISAPVSGTGFVVHREIIRKNEGWPFYLFSENMEFSADCILKGEKTAYCPKAVVYDEQPVRFVDSWTQRLRWTRGYYLIFHKYGLKLFAGIFRGSFACYDHLTMLSGGYLFLISCILTLVVSTRVYPFGSPELGVLLGHTIFRNLVIFYILLLLSGIIALLSEERRIRCSTLKKIEYLCLFPIFVFTYIPLCAAALFVKVRWQPIQHTGSGRKKN